MSRRLGHSSVAITGAASTATSSRSWTATRRSGPPTRCSLPPGRSLTADYPDPPTGGTFAKRLQIRPPAAKSERTARTKSQVRSTTGCGAAWLARSLGVKRSRVQIPAARLESAGQRPCLSTSWRRRRAIPAKSTRPRHRARSPHTLCSFVAQLLCIDDGGPGGVHGIGNGSEVTRVQMGVGPQEDGRIMAERGSCCRHRHAALGEQARRRVTEHVRRCPSGEAELRCEGIPDPVPPVRQPYRITNGVVNSRAFGSLPTRSSTWIRSSASTEAGISTTGERSVCVSLGARWRMKKKVAVQLHAGDWVDRSAALSKCQCHRDRSVSSFST